LPSYPVDAQREGIQGKVTLLLDIERDGRVSRVVALSGHSLLAPSALVAAKRLRFKPYYLDDESVPSKGQIIYLYAIVRGNGATVTLDRSTSVKAIPPEPQ
jgi:protein TonB